MKKLFYWFVLITIPFVVLVTIGELYGSVYVADKRLYRFDAELGWAPKSNFTYDRMRSDVAGNPHRVRLTTNEYGFRQWGDLDNDKPRIFFIGDSVTGDPNMSDVDAYFGRVSELLDAEVFAIGGGGYGTLQELMVLRKYVDIIDPDYFVLQFCINDFSNNSMHLESHSIVRNQKNLRPYLLDDGQVGYLLALGHWYRFLYRYSYIFRFLDKKFQIFQYNLYGGYIPPSSQGEEENSEETIRAEQTTERLLRMMADSVPGKTRIFTFVCRTKNQADTNRWMRVAENAGFISMPEVSEIVEKAEQEGFVIRASDGSHWGPKGHRIAGEVLAGELSRLINNHGKKSASDPPDIVY